MPRKSKPGSAYPPDWKAIATRVKDEAGWRCVRCGAPHDPRPGHGLTIHHADMDPGNSAWWNLLPLCCPCHLQIQHRVAMERPWVMGEHSPWFRPYAAGAFASRYLGLEISRDEALAFLPRLIVVERVIVLEVSSARDLYLSDLRRDILGARRLASSGPGEVLLADMPGGGAH